MIKFIIPALCLSFFMILEGQAQKVYKVKYESRADLKIYLVEYSSQAGWRNNRKIHLLRH